MSRKFLHLLAFVFLSSPVFAKEVSFYVGTYTDHSTRQGIYRGMLDTDTGKLGPLTLAAQVKNPNFLALSPDGKFLYAAEGVAHQQMVGAFAVEADGSLLALNEEPSGGEDTCHVAVDRTGRNVLVANYGSGSIACFRIKPDGSVGERTALIAFTGSGPNQARQKSPHAHSIYVSPDNAFVYACDLGTDRIWIFKLDAAHGTLTPNDPPSAQVPPGAGARHLVFSRDGRFVYVANEMGLSVTVFARNISDGSLTPLQTVPTLPPGTPAKDATVAEIALSPTGQWLYVSNRGCDTISVFAIDADGKLTLMQNAPALVKMPRHFALDPAGQWLITAGQKDNRIAVLKIDPKTGQLSATDQSATVGSPVCVLFCP